MPNIIQFGSTFDSGITPEGTIDITENGTYDITDYAEAEVAIPLPTISSATIDMSTVEYDSNSEKLFTYSDDTPIGTLVIEKDSSLIATNIRSGVTVENITGTLVEGITPSGTYDITTNGTYNVTEYSSVDVDVPSVIDIGDSTTMTSLLMTSNIGNVYQYTGETDDTYTSGNLYIVTEATE